MENRRVELNSFELFRILEERWRCQQSRNGNIVWSPLLNFPTTQSQTMMDQTMH